MNIITETKKEAAKTIIFMTALPAPDAGMSKESILRAFVADLRREAYRVADDILGGVVRLNGRMTTEMALAAGVVAARMGARAVELFDPTQGQYVPVCGDGSPLLMPTPILPGMEIEVVNGGLLRPGARAEVVNVGRESVNVKDGRGRGRDTAWTNTGNVKAVGWKEVPQL